MRLTGTMRWFFMAFPCLFTLLGSVNCWNALNRLTFMDTRRLQVLQPYNSRSDGSCRRTKSCRVFSTSSSSESKTKSHILYQKVVRPPPGVTDVIFLGSLIEYLQEHFQLPKRLPMVYQASVPQEDETRTILSWDSPLSPSTEATCMNVEVVGIFTSDDNATPDMAMVVVQKDAQASQAAPQLPPMLRNLFADSEGRILKALDRGLEDFMSGKIALDSSTNRPQRNEYEEAKRSILAEVVDDKEITSNAPKHFIEGEISLDESSSTSKLASKRETVLKSMNMEASQSRVQDEAKGLDFAIQAAKEVAAKRKEKRATEDYAVTMARQAAALRPKKQQTTATKKEGVSIDETKASLDESPKSIDLDYNSIRPPSLNPEALGPRAFMTTISTPGSFKNRNNSTTEAETKANDISLKTKAYKSSKAVGSVVNASSVSPKERRRKINISVKDDNLDVLDENIQIGSANVTAAPQDPIQQKIIESSQEALDEIAEASQDMSPEELLQDVLKFGEQQDKDNAVGRGFVSGAFDKAKELLREQKQNREERLRGNVVDQITAEVQGLASDNFGPQEVKELTPEEELRLMFEAGEKIADGRITSVASSSSGIPSTTGTTEEDVDRLIAGEKTVSRHARVLDDELAELELRINKSPGEELDGPDRSGIFDIFSGPEVYNPNVKPETAVNWPGALPGTKDIRLPRELDDAVKQARFAARVLARLEVKEETEDGDKTYSVGDRCLSQEQVNNLKIVVNEAVEIGLIDDPLVVAEERSRLQMILDELWDQPEERLRDIASSYKDLLLSDNFVGLIKERLDQMADRDLEALRHDDNSLESRHARERELLGQLIVYAQLLLKEARALGAELEAQQLEVIRSICKVAMDPSHQTEEETAMALSDAVRDMRPLLDDAFVAYLKYAVAEEEGRLARAGLLDDPSHNQWLFVLKIVQQGVYAEIARGINRYIEHIWYVLRMETPVERRLLLKKLVDVMPTLDVKPFVQVVENIVGSLGDSVKGEFDGVTPLGEMTNKLLQLRRDVKELLPPERIALMSRDADEWAAKQKERLLEQRNTTQQRLQAARETEHIDGEVESLGRHGEMERFD